MTIQLGQFMKKRSAISLLFIAILAFNTQAKQSQELDLAVEKISENIIMLKGVGGFTGGNIAISIQPDSVAMIDDGIASIEGKLLNAIKNITHRPIDYLINTHVHGDHIGNNAVLAKKGARIIGHDNLRTRLLNKENKSSTAKSEQVAVESIPVISFSQAMTLHFNNDSAQLIHLAHAHTDGDSFVFFKNANVIHTGDVMFNGLYPFIDYSSGGSLQGYIDAQKHIASFANNETKIIPGHGKLATKQDLLASINMLEDVQAQVKALLAQGKSAQEIAKIDPLKPYNKKWAWQFITAEKMLQQVITGIKNQK